MFYIRYTPGVFSEGTYRQRIPSKQIFYPSKIMIMIIMMIILKIIIMIIIINNRNRNKKIKVINGNEYENGNSKNDQ